MIKKALLATLVLVFTLTGCSSHKITFIGNSKDKDFINPQFIAINQFSQLPKLNSTKIITGSAMKPLINELRLSENHPVKDGAYSCPTKTQTPANPAWTYDFVIYFDNGKTMTFSLPTDSCNFIYDERDDRYFVSSVTDIEKYF